MSHAVAVGQSAPLSNQAKSTGFFAMLAVVTAVPIFLLPLHRMEIPSEINNLVLFAWIIAGYGHVMSTLWFGADRDYHAIIRNHWQRMLASLAVLPMIMAAIVLVSAAAAGWAYAFYIVWLAHHYNRQNYGLLSFAAGHDKFGPLPREIGWMLHLTTAAGAIRMVAMPTIYPGMSPLADPVFAHWGWYVAAVPFAIAVMLFAWVVARERRLWRSPTTLLFLTLSLIFFMPSFNTGPHSTSFLPYAMAHGAQYLLIMGVTARQSRFGLWGVLLIAYLVMALGFVAYSITAIPWAQAYVGVVMWHFLVDARLWRLRDPAVRAVVKSRFGFLFG